MFDILILLLINSLLCLGFWHACDFSGAEEFDNYKTNQGRRHYAKERGTPDRVMIFWRLRWYGGQFLPPWTTKPLYRCLTCMASLHSIIPYGIAACVYMQDPWLWIYWPLYVLALAGVNSIITRV